MAPTCSVQLACRLIVDDWATLMAERDRRAVDLGPRDLFRAVELYAHGNAELVTRRQSSTAHPSLGHAHGMLFLSRVTGQDVLGPDGRVAGRLADLTVRLDEQAGPHLVERLLVRRHRAPDLLMPWAAIESFENTCVSIHGPDDPISFAITSTTEALGDDEILLGRDVLDTQVIDVVGQRLARVADVVLTRTADDRLELVAAEVGFGGVLRRLGLHRLAARAHEDVVAWTDLHLTSERGHTVQLATPRSAVHHLDAAGLAALVSRLGTESAAEVLAATGSRVAADVVRAADPFVGERVLRAMPDADAATIVAAMPAKHATRWRDRLAHPPAFLGRRFIRSRVWPRRRRHTPDAGRDTGDGPTP